MGGVHVDPIPNSYEELEKEFKKIRSCVTDDTLFTAKALLYIAKLLSEKKKRKRKPSKYNLFIKEKLKEGMTLKQAIEEWRKLKKK